LEVRQQIPPIDAPGKEVTDLSLERIYFFRYFREWKRGFRNMLRENPSSLLMQFAWSSISIASLK
jgi:hypothetical protein